MKFLKGLVLSLMIVALVGGMAFASGQQQAGGQMEKKGKVELAYVEWARAVAITHVAGEILGRMGYDVRLDNVANAAMWQAVAAGDADALLCAWLPVTHQNYYGPDGRFTDQVVDVGKNYTGAKLGLVVPAYVQENSIADLVANGDKYGWEIVGIDPGAGMMQATEKAINDNVYGLGKFKLIEGSGPTMTAALGQAVKEKNPIVVTGWAPHWMFGRWDLKILDDPKGVFGKAEHIDTVVRKGLEQDKPEVYKFLANFDWLSIDLGQSMVWNQEGMDPAESAKKFVDENLDKIKAAMPEGMSL